MEINKRSILENKFKNKLQCPIVFTQKSSKYENTQQNFVKIR